MVSISDACQRLLEPGEESKQRRANGMGTCAHRSEDRGVTSSQERGRVSLTEVTPRQAKGHWALGGPHDRRGLGLIKPGTPNRSQGQGRSGEQTRHSWGGCEPALELPRDVGRLIDDRPRL